MTHGQRYRITITAKSSKTFSVPMRFESSAPDASKTINLTTSYQTFYLDFTYDSTTQYHSFTFYSKNYTAGQTITFKDIRISKLLAPSSTYGTLPTLTKTGYTFDGWWTAASGKTPCAARPATSAPPSGSSAARLSWARSARPRPPGPRLPAAWRCWTAKDSRVSRGSPTARWVG